MGPGDATGGCFGCRHLVVTHDRTWPRACLFFRIRTRGEPAAEVLRASGEPCRARDPARPASGRSAGGPALRPPSGPAAAAAG